MSNIKARFVQVIKVLGLMAVVGALAAAAFPASSFAAPATATGNDYGKAAITVYDASSPSLSSKPVPVADAIVEIVNSAGTVISKANTDANGNARLGLAPGAYKIRVSAKGYNEGGSYFKIQSGYVTDVTIGLTSVP